MYGLKEWVPGEEVPTRQVLPHVQQTKMQQLEDRLHKQVVETVRKRGC